MKTDLQTILDLNPLIIGIGNTLRGDDAAGVLLVDEILAAGYSPALTVHSNPENYLQKIAAESVNARLWIDIINWNGAPGDYRVFTRETIGQYAISTHNFSPVLLVEYLNTLKNVPDYFLGIQPQSIAMGEKISEPVASTLKKLKEIILEKYFNSATDKRQ